MLSLSPLIIELEPMDIISNLVNEVVLWMPLNVTLLIVSLMSGPHYHAIGAYF